MADPVVLSEEPETFKVTVNDPTKPKAIATARKIPPKENAKEKLIHAFFGAEVNSDNLGEHIVKDYAEPTAKKILNTVAQSVLHKLGDAVQMLLFGKIVDNKNGPVDYTSFSNPGIASAPVAHKLTDKVETFVFSTRQEALKVLDYLKGLIATYGSASVLNYYEAVQEPPDYMMADRGWMDLSSAEVRNTPEGWIIDLPRPIALKRG